VVAAAQLQRSPHNACRLGKARRRAIDAHERLRVRLGELSNGMEVVVSDFEDLERWRFVLLDDYLETLAVSFANLAKRLGRARDGLADGEAPAAPPGRFVVGVSIGRAEADPGLQPLRVNPAVGRHIAPDTAFPDDEGIVMRVTERVEATGGRLALEPRELVLVQGDGPEPRCRDVNDCVGTFPRTALRVSSFAPSAD